jgi:rhodanese-related sulfurtransferase
MPVPEISPSELKIALSRAPEQRPVLLDVRRPEEHAFVALPDSVLIPLQELDAGG